ncbi:hypothetical protein J2X69_002302 [Algoriphagus sp. 4150]|nr:hypothetical protein [Algoriphagus sp. 4150]
MISRSHQFWRKVSRHESLDVRTENLESRSVGGVIARNEAIPLERLLGSVIAGEQPAPMYGSLKTAAKKPQVMRLAPKISNPVLALIALVVKDSVLTKVRLLRSRQKSGLAVPPRNDVGEEDLYQRLLGFPRLNTDH